MKQYSDYIGHILESVQKQQDVSRGKATNMWFEEFYEVPNRDDLILKYKGVISCQDKVVIKEALDSQAIIARARYIRNKKRADFFVANAIRLEGVSYKLEQKVEKLNIDE